MNNKSLIPRHNEQGEAKPQESSWKSDVNITAANSARMYESSRSSSTFKRNCSVDSYYKHYDHDTVPVKEDSQKAISANYDTEAGDSSKMSLTNSQLEKLEKKIYSTISQELQTDNSSVGSLESNIKFFKTTVLELFENFYASMRDFEVYKKRFDDILAKNRVDAVGDMEIFIKDMINHIMSSDSNIIHDNEKVEHSTTGTKDKGDVCIDQKSSNVANTAKLLESLHSVVEQYKNDHYHTDSTLEEGQSKLNTAATKEEIFNIYLLSGAPCVQIKMNERHLLSEINIKDPSLDQKTFASAGNIRKLAEKTQDLEENVQQQEISSSPERDIPVKVSFAKKNIHLDEDFQQEREKEENRSFLSKICHFICKKLRRS